MWSRRGRVNEKNGVDHNTEGGMHHATERKCTHKLILKKNGKSDMRDTHELLVGIEEGGTCQDMDRQELTETRRKGGDSVFGGQGCGEWGVRSGEGEKTKRIF